MASAGGENPCESTSARLPSRSASRKSWYDSASEPSPIVASSPPGSRLSERLSSVCALL